MNPELYPIFKSIHAILMSSAFILLLLGELLRSGAGYLVAASGPYRWSQRFAKIAEPLSLTGLLAGLATAVTGGWSLLTPWLILAYFLIILSFVIGGIFVAPWQRRVDALIAESNGETTPEIQQVFRERRAMIGRWAALVLFLGIMVVMRTKPSFGSAVPEISVVPTQTAVVEDAPAQAAVEYTVQTVMGGTPALAFAGVGGSIDGAVNPTLTANVGDVVTITLVNNHGMPHDFTIGQLGIATEQLSSAGQTSVTFTVTEAGDFMYYCSVPGHREAGMYGILRVSAA